MSSPTLSDIALVVTHLPILEVVIFILLCYSSYSAGDCSKKRDGDKDEKVQRNLMWIRIFAGLYCVGFFLKWLTFFYVFPGRIMPLKGQKSIANSAAVFFFVVGDWFRYGMLPAGALCVILHLLNAYKQLHGSKLNPYVKNIIIFFFVSALIFRFVFQYQTATNHKVIDVCYRPMTCNPMWFISACLSGWILWKAKKAASLLEQGTLSPDHQARQTLLFRKLWAMFIGCCIAVVGRTIQLMGCESPHTIESNFTYRFVKRVATFGVLVTELIVSWHSLHRAKPKTSTFSRHDSTTKSTQLTRVVSASQSGKLGMYLDDGNHDEPSATPSVGSDDGR